MCDLQWGSTWFNALGTLAQLPVMFQGVDAGIVAVAPGDLIGVVANRRQGRRPQRRQFGGLDHAERVGRLQTLLAAAGARAVVAQLLPAVNGAMAVVPL